MKSAVLPIPVEEEIQRLVSQVAAQTGLSKADVMRLGLRHGVPLVARQVQTLRAPRLPACFAYLEEYPLVPDETLRRRKMAFRRAMRRKHAAHR